MSFIIRNDLYNTLNKTDIDVLCDDDYILNTIVVRAIEEVKSFIQHRYNVDLVFIDVNTYAGATTYAIGEMLYYGDKYYTCIAESIGNLPTDIDYFTPTDSRDQSIVDITCVIIIFYLFRRGTPRTAPEWIVSEYDRVKKDLVAYQKGTRTILLPVNLDDDGEEEGARIVYTSETQKDWSF